MKISYVVDNHSPAYGGPYTVISEQLHYLYKNNIDVELIYNSNSFVKYNRDYRLILNNTDIVHIFGIWRPFHIKAFNSSKKLKKKNNYITFGSVRTLVTESKKHKEKNCMEYLSKENFKQCRLYTCHK